MERTSLAAVPYCGAAPLPGEILLRWNADPVLIAALTAATLLGWRWIAPGPQRRAFTAGMAALVIAFLSPLCALSSGLFAARSAHHLLLAAVAAPLLGYAVRVPSRLPLGAALGVHVAIFWAWHLPAVYQAALSSDAIYWLMQLSILGSAMLFWSRAFHEAGGGAVAAALAAVTLQMGLLGALLTFAPAPLYTPHLLTAALYGLTALQDQQLAGLVMWVVSLPLYAAAAAPILARQLAAWREMTA